LETRSFDSRDAVKGVSPASTIFGMDDHVIATRKAYERYAEAYAHHRSDRSAIRPFIERFVALLPGGASVLDVGCGPGVDTGSLALRGMRTVGLDIAASMLELAAPHTDGRVVQADQRCLPFAAGSFDGVWANACLLHLSKREAGRALAEIARVLTLGGVAYTAVQRGSGESLELPSDASRGVQAPRFFARFEVDEWASLLKAAGFELLDAVDSDDHQRLERHWLNVFARKR
jgi:SAM-dependent methyltransferase